MISAACNNLVIEGACACVPFAAAATMAVSTCPRLELRTAPFMFLLTVGKVALAVRLCFGMQAIGWTYAPSLRQGGFQGGGRELGAGLVQAGGFLVHTISVGTRDLERNCYQFLIKQRRPSLGTAHPSAHERHPRPVGHRAGAHQRYRPRLLPGRRRGGCSQKGAGAVGLSENARER